MVIRRLLSFKEERIVDYDHESLPSGTNSLRGSGCKHLIKAQSLKLAGSTCILQRGNFCQTSRFDLLVSYIKRLKKKRPSSSCSSHSLASPSCLFVSHPRIEPNLLPKGPVLSVIIAIGGIVTAGSMLCVATVSNVPLVERCPT